VARALLANSLGAFDHRRVEVNLTVRDPLRSAAWYIELLGMEKRYDSFPSDGRVSYVCLDEPRRGLVLCLVGHPMNPGEPFSEARTGLDHLEFLVVRREDLDEWASRLDEPGIEHSGVRTPPYTQNAMLTFRDPDNIQLEFFWRAVGAFVLPPEVADGTTWLADREDEHAAAMPTTTSIITRVARLAGTRSGLLAPGRSCHATAPHRTRVGCHTSRAR